MKFELSGVEIDRNRNVGITIKNYVNDKVLIALNAGWNSRSDTKKITFRLGLLLNMLLSFYRDYKS